MSVVLVGISHHQAPVELRERAALDPQRASELGRQLAGDAGIVFDLRDVSGVLAPQPLVVMVLQTVEM